MNGKTQNQLKHLDQMEVVVEKLGEIYNLYGIMMDAVSYRQEEIKEYTEILSIGLLIQEKINTLMVDADRYICSNYPKYSQ